MLSRIFLLIALLSLGLSSCSSPPQNRTAAHGASLDIQNDKLSAALAEAERILARGIGSAEQRLAYATVVGRVSSLWLSLSDAKRSKMNVGPRYMLESRYPAHLRFDELIPAASIKSKEFKTRHLRDGVGAPMVAHWKYTAERKASEPFMPEAGHISPVTATLDFSQAAHGRHTAILTLHDARVTDAVRFQGKNQPLAADFSAHGEYLASIKQARMAGLKALLRSANYMDKLGLLSLEHPAPGKIPLVLVHGLMSRPATWENVIHEFTMDPLIRRHYQIFVFRYPSGVPIGYSSEKLRENLATLHSILVKEGAGSTARNMVLIGHSMGGLVSKAQVQSSSEQRWGSALGTTPELLRIGQKEHDKLRKFFEFEANPNISRVIFAATPHRGSAVADSRLAHFGRKLVSLPVEAFGGTLQVVQNIAQRDPMLSKVFAHGMPTSVDNLSPHSFYVKVANTLPFRAGVHLHSIIGNHDGKALTDPKCSDGFVPYISSHLQGVESELIVTSDHSVHERPEAIQEMRRILHLHLKKLGLK
jgi:triacylglycerol esterase/lipase EstA (alpha/beta hydrolase family)